MNRVNDLLSEKLVGQPKIEFIRIDSGFVSPDGSISHHDMYDYLLLTNSGCLKAFSPVHELLIQLLNESDFEKDLSPSE